MILSMSVTLLYGERLARKVFLSSSRTSSWPGHTANMCPMVSKEVPHTGHSYVSYSAGLNSPSLASTGRHLDHARTTTDIVGPSSGSNVGAPHRGQHGEVSSAALLAVSLCQVLVQLLPYWAPYCLVHKTNRGACCHSGGTKSCPSRCKPHFYG